mmetsp:Transcript_28473/g.47858  ORF Transcript_28473/g.47858 Transcript_28473/m.47858 type:complete len:376 (+) Transcript_28473:78-1205(+)
MSKPKNPLISLSLNSDLDEFRAALVENPHLCSEILGDTTMSYTAALCRMRKEEAVRIILEMEQCKVLLSTSALSIAAGVASKLCSDSAGNILKMLINAGADVNYKFTKADFGDEFPDGCTCLHLASARGNLLGVEILLDNGADTEIYTTEKHFTPVGIAVKSAVVGCENIMKKLTRSTRNFPACMKCANLLLERGASPNCKDDDEYTPMYLLVSSGQTLMTQLLSSFGADRKLNAAKLDFEDVEELSMEHDNCELTAFLAESGEWTPLHHVYILNVERAEKLLLAGADLNAVATHDRGSGDVRKQTPLSIAAEILARPETSGDTLRDAKARRDAMARQVATLITTWSNQGQKRKRSSAEEGSHSTGEEDLKEKKK